MIVSVETPYVSIFRPVFPRPCRIASPQMPKLKKKQGRTANLGIYAVKRGILNSDKENV